MWIWKALNRVKLVDGEVFLLASYTALEWMPNSCVSYSSRFLRFISSDAIINTILFLILFLSCYYSYRFSHVWFTFIVCFGLPFPIGFDSKILHDSKCLVERRMTSVSVDKWIWRLRSWPLGVPLGPRNRNTSAPSGIIKQLRESSSPDWPPRAQFLRDQSRGSIRSIDQSRASLSSI